MSEIKTLAELNAEDAAYPGHQTHEALWAVCKKLPEDHAGYGDPDRPHNPQCVEGCRFYHILNGYRGADWGVCANPASHRAGLLTFEHQGCGEYEHDERMDAYIDKHFPTAAVEPSDTGGAE